MGNSNTSWGFTGLHLVSLFNVVKAFVASKLDLNVEMILPDVVMFLLSWVFCVRLVTFIPLDLVLVRNTFAVRKLANSLTSIFHLLLHFPLERLLISEVYKCPL